MSLYSTDATKAGTFKLQPWSGTAIFADIAIYNGKKYIYASDPSCVPVSTEATYEIAVLTVDDFINLSKVVSVGIPSKLKEYQTVYSTTDKQSTQIPVWANPPVGFTSQIPREFDEWDGSLWITNLVARNKGLKARKMAEINTAFEAALSALCTEYPESEIMSWTKQESEARRYLTDNTKQTPLIDRIVEMRDIDKNELINKVILKADQYAYAVGMAIGRRQYLEQLVMATAIGKESELEQYHF